MQRLDINSHAEFGDRKPNPEVIADGVDMRVLLLRLRAGQQVKEHSAAGGVTIQAISGRVTFYEGDEACEMSPGTLVRVDAGRAHRVDAHTDAALLVTMVRAPRTSGRSDAPRAAGREIDLRLTPRPERHPLIFDAFDRLEVGGSFIIINDHDPRPLRAQIDRMRAGEMGWEYLDRGPDTFRVRLTRIAPPAGGVGPVDSGTAESPVNIGSRRQEGSGGND